MDDSNRFLLQTQNAYLAYFWHSSLLYLTRIPPCFLTNGPIDAHMHEIEQYYISFRTHLYCIDMVFIEPMHYIINPISLTYFWYHFMYIQITAIPIFFHNPISNIQLGIKQIVQCSWLMPIIWYNGLNTRIFKIYSHPMAKSWYLSTNIKMG